MKWLLFLVGLALIGAAAVGFLASIDLLTTEVGVLYATCAVTALAAGLVFLALGAMTYRIDALRKAVLRRDSGEATRQAPPGVDFAPPVAVEPQWREPADQPIVSEPIDDLRPGAEAPAPAPIESEPHAPTLVGKYSAGGASYQIYSDGSIEAKTG